MTTKVVDVLFFNNDKFKLSEDKSLGFVLDVKEGFDEFLYLVPLNGF